MGALYQFIEKEFSSVSGKGKLEVNNREPAKIANLAKVNPKISNFSNFSAPSIPKITFGAQVCACGAMGNLSDNWYLKNPEAARWRCFKCLDPTRIG